MKIAWPFGYDVQLKCNNGKVLLLAYFLLYISSPLPVRNSYVISQIREKAIVEDRIFFIICHFYADSNNIKTVAT